MEVTLLSIATVPICSLNEDHGGQELLQHDIFPDHHIVRVKVSSLNNHEKLSPQVLVVSPRTVLIFLYDIERIYYFLYLFV